MVEKEGLSLVLYVESFLCPQGFLGGDLGGEVWEKKDLLWGGEEKIGI